MGDARRSADAAPQVEAAASAQVFFDGYFNVNGDQAVIRDLLDGAKLAG